MKLSLRQKINFAILVTFAVIATIFTVVQVPLQKHRLRLETDNIKLLLQTLVERDEEEFANEIFDDRIKALQIRIKEISDIDGIICTCIFNNSGKLLVSNSDHFIDQPITLKSLIETTKHSQIKTFGSSKQKVLVFSKHLSFLGENTGFILIYYSLENLIQNQKTSILIFAGLMFMTLIAMLFLLNLILSGAILEPIMNLVDSSKAIVQGNYDSVVHMEQTDEIGELSKSFDQMRLAVKEKIGDIEQIKERYRLLYQQAPAMLCSIDSQGRIIEVNNLLLETLGLSRKKLIGCQSFDFFPSQKAVNISSFLKKMLKDSNTVKSQPYQIVSQGGVIFDTLISVFAQKDPNGNIIQATLSIQDITETKRANEEKEKLEHRLAQSQKMEAIGTLAGGIAHDFNNMLSGIFGFAQLAKNHLQNPERAAKDIDNIFKMAQKATELVRQILTFSQKSNEQKVPLHLHIIVKEAMQLLRASIPSTVEIKESIQSKATVMANPTSIHQIIMNLGTNAYHAMQEKGGILAVTLKEVEFSDQDTNQGTNMVPGKYLKLEVSDNGSGMDETTVAKIFEPYFTTKEAGKGTGLGLSVVLGIIEDHKGQIKTYSEAGQGTTFHVYLPIVDRKAELTLLENEEETANILGSETILMVDDEKTLLKSSETLLEEMGYTVTAFSNGLDALEAFKKTPEHFDVVITDMTMPAMTGAELSVEILKINPEQKIILCTGHSELINKERALSMGIKTYFEKPIIIKELAKQIRIVLDEK